MRRRGRELWQGVWQLGAPVLTILLLVGVGLLTHSSLGSKLGFIGSNIFSNIPPFKLYRAFSEIGGDYYDPSNIQSVPVPGPCDHTLHVVVDSGSGRWGQPLQALAAISANDMWVVGSSDNDATRAPLAAHWDGAAWEPFPTESMGSLNGFQAVAAVDSNDVWAVGYQDSNAATLVQHWDGTKWKIVPSPNAASYSFNTLYGVAAISANDVWAVGESHNETNHRISTGQVLIEHWNGSQWIIISAPQLDGVSSLKGIVAISANDIWMVGSHAVPGSSEPQPLFLHRVPDALNVVPGDNLEQARPLASQENGNQPTISPKDVQIQGGSLNAVAALSPDDVWAVGVAIGDKLDFALAEHWDGRRWTIVPSRPVRLHHTSASYTAVAVASHNDVWMTYNYNNLFPNTEGAMLEHWDGKDWDLELTGQNYGQPSLFGVVALPTTEVWVVGSQNVSAYPLPLILYYAGSCENKTPLSFSSPISTPTAQATVMLTELPAFTQAPAPLPTSTNAPTITPIPAHSPIPTKGVSPTTTVTLTPLPAKATFPAPSPTVAGLPSSTPQQGTSLTETPSAPPTITTTPTITQTFTKTPTITRTRTVTNTPTITTTLTITLTPNYDVSPTNTPLPGLKQ